MSAPVKKCEVCLGTGSTDTDFFGPLDCTHCTAADERVAMGKELGPMSQLAEIFAWRAYQLGKAAATDGERDAALIELSIFEDGQWWVKELDEAVENGTGDQKRAVAVVRRMLKVAARAVYHADVDAAAPVVPVAAQPVVQQEPIGWLCQRVQQNGKVFESWEYYPTKVAQNLMGKAGLRANDSMVNWKPLYAAPSLEAQPAGEVIPAEKLCALLPGTYYMDPPDGGSVTVLEQVERMAEDAARYRWLLANYATGDGYHKIDAALNDGDADKYLNAAIDEAMAQGEKL